MKKLNILHIVNKLGIGGAQLTVQTLSRYINKDIFGVYICGLNDSGIRGKELEKEGFEVVIASSDADKVQQFIEDKNINIIHFHRSGRKEKLHTDIVMRNMDKVLIETNIFGEYDKSTSHLFDIHLFKSIFALNERYLVKEKGLIWDKHGVLYNPVDLKKWDKLKPNQRDLKNLRKKLGIRKDDFVVGKIGSRVAIEKWSDLILDFVPYAKKRIPNLKLIVQGVPKSRIRKARKLGIRIAKEGENYKELTTLYNVIDVQVHLTKRGENSGNSINEAMVYEKPVIVNSTPRKDNGQLEQVIHMKNGIIASHPQTIAQAVEYLHNNPEERVNMGRAGWLKIEKEYSAEKITKVLEKVYIEKAKIKYPNISEKIRKYPNSIKYYPSEEEIVDYNNEYQTRKKQCFGQLTLLNMFGNILRIPNRLRIKVFDVLRYRL